MTKEGEFKDVAAANLAAERDLLCTTIEACHRIDSPEALDRIVMRFVRSLIPHAASVFGIGNMETREHLLYRNLGFSPQMLNVAMSRFSIGDNVLFAAWERMRLPQYVALEDMCDKGFSESQRRWRDLLLSYGYVNLAMHGIVDVSGKYSSFFFFGELAGPLTDRQSMIFQMLTPHLHHALLTLVSAGGTAMSDAEPSLVDLASMQVAAKSADDAVRAGLTLRETEVLQWLALGKTNVEIASILGISDLTVRNHVHNMMLKLGVGNRTQAVVVALQRNLIA